MINQNSLLNDTMKRYVRFRLPDDLLNALKKSAADNHLTQSDILRRALIDYLKRNGYIWQ